MGAIRQQHGRIGNHVLEQERHERHAKLRGDVAVDLVKRHRVLAAVIRQGSHSAQNDRDPTRKFDFTVATGTPRRPSLTPMATTSTRTSPRSACASRRTAPDDVSPEMPALTTW